MRRPHEEAPDIAQTVAVGEWNRHPFTPCLHHRCPPTVYPDGYA